MKFRGICILVGLFSLESYDFQISAMKLIPEQKAEGIWIHFTVNPGYGVQKDGKHSLALYELKNGHEKETNLEKKFTNFGKEINKITVFRGKTAKEDKSYYSSLDPVFFKGKYNKSYLLKGRFFVCSFSQKFCTVQNILLSLP